MIKHCIFDLGNVMVTYHAKAYLQSKFADPKLCNLLYEHIFGSPEWLLLDEGLLKEPQFCDQLVRQYPEQKEAIIQALDHWDDSLILKEDSLDLAKALQDQGIDLYILSNIQSEVYQRLINRYPELKSLFKDALISAEVKLIKPDPAIFQLCLQQFNLEASECLFFDDTYENIETAKKLGIHAVWFQDINEVKKALSAFQLCL